MSVLLVTSVLLRSGVFGPSTNPTVVSTVQSLILSGEEVVCCPQVLYELWVVGTRPASANGSGWSTAEASQYLAAVRASFPCRPDPLTILDTWLDLCERYAVTGKPAHDARLVAYMIDHGIGQILTLNPADFSRYTEITVTTC